MDPQKELPTDEMYKLPNEHRKKILVELADKSICYYYMSNKTYRFFYKINLYISNLIIILIIFCGSAMYAVSNVKSENKYSYTVTIGTVMYFAAILKFLQSKLELEKLSEHHRIYNNNWNNLYAQLKFEILSEEVSDKFFKYLCEEYFKLEKNAGFIPKKIINSLNDLLEDDKYKNMFRPLACGKLLNTDTYIKYVLNTDLAKPLDIVSNILPINKESVDLEILEEILKEKKNPEEIV